MNALLRPLTLLPFGLAATLLAALTSAPSPVTAEPVVVSLAADDADLETCMDALKVNLKTVSASLGRADGEADSLKALSAMQVWALKGKSLLPPSAANVPAAKRAAFERDFRAGMAKLLMELAQIEIHVLQGHSDVALKGIEGGLLKLRDESHEKFQEKH